MPRIETVADKDADTKFKALYERVKGPGNKANLNRKMKNEKTTTNFFNSIGVNLHGQCKCYV